MKTFLLKFFAFCIALSALILIGAFAFPQNKKSYSYAVAIKHQLLDATKSPRLIFVSGSNGAFGLDSEKIAAGTPMNPVNMALHAGSGLYFMLDSICPKLQAGDTVIFAFEYKLFYGEAAGNKDEIAREVFSYPKSIPNLRPQILRDAFCGLPNRCIAQTTSFFRRIFRAPETEDSAYRADGMNDFCDLIAHLNLPPKKIRSDKWNNESLDFRAVFEFTKTIKNLRSRGVRVFVFPPVYQKSSFENGKEKIAELASIFEENGIPYQAVPARYALDDSMFYDTTYHCNAAGRERRTELLIDDLNRLLQEK